jgi:hypothetical protein
LTSPVRAQTTPARTRQPANAELDWFRRTAGPSWRRGESRHFIVYREQPVTAMSLTATIDSLEAAWVAAASLLGQRFAEMPPATVFITASRTRFAPFVHPDWKGLTTRLPSGDDVIVFVQNDSVRLYTRHEVMHFVSLRTWGWPGPRPWLIEGLATFADGKCQSSTILAVGRDLLKARPVFGIQDVVENFMEMAKTERATAYVLAGSLVDYLWSSRGRDAFHRLWTGRDSLTDVGLLPGMSGEATAAWRAHVVRKAGTTSGLTPSAFARTGCG